MSKLNDKQERFCREYIVDLNGTQAAIRAGYSPRSAEMQASRLLSNDKVSERVAALKAEAAQRNDITVDRVLAEYAKLAFYDPAKIFKATVGGDPYIDMSDAGPAEWAAVKSVQCEDYLDGRGEDVREVRKVKVTLGDKRDALDSLAKHLGMFKDRVEHSGTVNIQSDLSRLTTEELKALLALSSKVHGEDSSAG